MMQQSMWVYAVVYTRMNMGNEMLLMGEVFPSVN